MSAFYSLIATLYLYGPLCNGCIGIVLNLHLFISDGELILQSSCWWDLLSWTTPLCNGAHPRTLRGHMGVGHPWWWSHGWRSPTWPSSMRPSSWVTYTHRSQEGIVLFLVDLAYFINNGESTKQWRGSYLSVIYKTCDIHCGTQWCKRRQDRVVLWTSFEGFIEPQADILILYCSWHSVHLNCGVDPHSTEDTEASIAFIF